MKSFALFLVLIFFSPAWPLAAAEKSPHEMYDALKSLRVDPSVVYRFNASHHIQLRRGDAVISFEDGAIAFFSPFEGQVTGAVFSGRGHILAVPRDPVEKQQMGRFLGAPVLDQEFINGYLRFTDDTTAELLQQFRSANLAPQAEPAISSQWDNSVAQMNASYTLRILFDRLSPNPKPCFYAGFEGAATGPFDVVFDTQRDEPFLLGQLSKANGTSYYDVWTSHSLLDSRPHKPVFHALRYSIDAVISPDNSLAGSAALHLLAETGAERVLAFQLARSLTIDSVTDDGGQPLSYFQNEGMNLQERSTRGNDYVQVVLPQVPAAHQEFTINFHYRGNVIENAGNGVLFVGARESWYPHFGDSAEFSQYEFSLRWPRKLRLIATGSKVEEHEEGDFRVGHWKTEKPMSVAGFNLGEYLSVAVPSGAHSIAVYANRQLEESLRKRLASPDPYTLPIPTTRFGVPGTDRSALPPAPPPSPADALKQLGKDIDSSISFYETYCGPFPFRDLSVSQIPGNFGQGWPGLLYVSTYSFLRPEVQEQAGLSTISQEHFTELVPYHEAAHQWWGNVVAWSSYHDQWIDEAIANYLALLFADTKKNPDHTLRVWLARYRKQLLEKPDAGSEPPDEIGSLILGIRLNSSKSPDAYEKIIYSKGTWVIHMLREMLRQPGAKNPDARFNGFLRSLVTKYAYRPLSTGDLRKEVEGVMTPAMDLEGGHSMEWFFEEWVRGTGIPHYKVEFTTHHTEKGLEVRGKLFQTQVPRSFIARVPLYDGGPHGAFLGAVAAAGPETSFHFTVQNPPHKIVIDPQMTVLCTTE